MSSRWEVASNGRDQPKESVARVRADLKRVVERIRQQVQDLYDRAARLQGGSLSNLLPAERPTAQSQLDILLAQLTEHRQRTNSWAESVADASFIARVRERGASTPAEDMLKPVIVNITKRTQDLPQIGHAIAEIEQKVLAFSLSSEEEAVLTKLDTLWQETGASGEIELGLLLQSLDNQENGWECIAQLYAKQRLRIQVAPVVFS